MGFPLRHLVLPTRGSRAQRVRRRSGLAVLVGLGLFIGFQVFLTYALDHWYPELRDPFYGYKAARLAGRLRDDPRPLSVVMVGSSRTAFGFKSSAMESRLRGELGEPVVAFNFGVPGAGPITQLLHLRRMVDEGIRPDLVLLEVLPPLLSSQAAMPWEAHWLPAERLDFQELGWLAEYGFPAEQMSERWWQSRPVPCYGHRFAILSRIAPAWLSYQFRQDWGRGDDESGWSTASMPPRDEEQRRRAVERARHEYAAYLEGFRLGGPSCKALEESLDLCRREGIHVVLVVMPEGATFRSWYPAGAWDCVQGYLDRLGSQFDAPVIVAREWLPEDDFSDSHHLLERGADQFTRRLTDLIIPQCRGARCAE